MVLSDQVSTGYPRLPGGSLIPADLVFQHPVIQEPAAAKGLIQLDNRKPLPKLLPKNTFFLKIHSKNDEGTLKFQRSIHGGA